MTKNLENDKKSQTRNIGVRLPLAIYEEMNIFIAAGRFTSYSDMVVSLIRDYLVREDMKKVQILELCEFFRSDEGRELISELVDQEIYRRATEPSMAKK